MAKDTKNKNVQIFATEAFLKDFSLLAELSVGKIIYLAEALNDDKGFGVPSDENFDLAGLLDKTGTNPDQFNSIFSVSKFIYEQVAKGALEFNELFKHLKEIAQANNLPNITRKKKAFEKLFTIREKFRKVKATQPYIRGVDYFLKSIKSTTELRAIYPIDDKDSTEVLGYCPIASIRLEVFNDEENEKDLVFTIRLKALEKVLERLNVVKSKLETLHSDAKKHNFDIIDWE